MTFGLIFLLFIAAFILIKSADFVVLSLIRLSRKSKTKIFALSAIFMSLGTCFPELVVAITSSLEGRPNLSLGNVMGANIANIALVVGIAGIITGGVNVKKSMVRREMIVAIIAAILPFILILDGTLSRVDGLILLAAYGVYVVSFLKGGYLAGEQSEEKKEERESLPMRMFTTLNHVNVSTAKELVKLFGGIAVLLFSAEMVVRSAVGITDSFRIPLFLIGLVFLSIGTTLPDLAFSIRSLKDKHPSMFMGNLLGSIITNFTLVAGVAAVIHPIQVESMSHYLIAVSAFAVVFIALWFFIRTKSRIERWEAAVLLLIYLVFIVVEFA